MHFTSDTLNCMPILKHCILQTILNVFLLFIFVWNKIFSSKTEPRFVWLGLGWYFVLVWKIMYFWCSFCKVMGNQGFFSYDRYNLLGIAIKTFLCETSANAYFRHYVTHCRVWKKILKMVKKNPEKMENNEKELKDLHWEIAVYFKSSYLRNSSQ